MLVEEILASLHLCAVNFAHEAEMDHSLQVEPPDLVRGAVLIINVLEATESSAHRRPNDQLRVLFFDMPPSRLSVPCNVEVPASAQVEGCAWR